MTTDDINQQIESIDPKEIYKLISSELEAAKNDNNDENKINHLKKAQNIILSSEEIGTVLDNFIDDFLHYLEEEGPIDVKLYIFEFIQRVFERDPSVLKKVNGALVMTVLRDLSVDPTLVKKCIVLITQLYPHVLLWVSSKPNDNEASSVWDSFGVLKSKLMQLVDSRNEGIRVYMMRFLETVVICQTPKSDTSDISRLNYDMSLNQVSRGHRFISYRQLEMEAMMCFDNLTKQISSSRTSLLHLISALTAMAHISRARPKFMDQMIESFESLHQNLPPTLGTGQVKSVRKELKNNFLRLLKHPSVYTKHLNKVQVLLQELGASTQEISRNMPSPNELSAALKKRVEAVNAQKRAEQMAQGPLSKKFKLDDEEYDDEKAASAFDDQEELVKAQQKGIDITTDWIVERMHGDVISKLVYINLLTMPDEMPPAFNASYYNIPAEITEPVKRNLSRILARQFTREGKGPGAAYFIEQKKKFMLAKQKAKQEGAIIPPTPMDLREDKSEVKLDKEGFKIPTLSVSTKKTALKYDLYSETQQLEKSELKEVKLLIFKKMMESEGNLTHPLQRQNLYKALICMTARRSNKYTSNFEEQLMSYVIVDQEKRADVIFLWLKELYDQLQGVKFCIRDDSDNVVYSKAENHERYDTLLVNFLTKLYTAEKHKYPLFYRVFTEAPIVTQGALALLRKACIDLSTYQLAMSTLKELILNKNIGRQEFLKMLLELSYVEQDMIRSESIVVTKQLFDVDYMRSDLQKFLYDMCLKAAEKTVPPLIVMASSGFENVEVAEEDEVQWNENYARSALTLVLHMIPFDTSLISELCTVMAKANQKVKKFIIGSVKANQISVDDANLLYAIDHCPPGGEPLIARFVTLLTERLIEPTPELVERLKNLVSRYNSDVRALIPILPGMTKEECLELVPQFVLNSTCMRSVPTFYKKILRSTNPAKPPLVTVTELMLKLHSIQGVNRKAVTLLHDNIDVLLVDKSNEFFDESVRIPSAIESLADLPEVNQFVFHSFERIYEKYPSMGPKLSKLLLKCAQKQGWVENTESWDAFKSCVKSLDEHGFAAVIFGINFDKFVDIANESLQNFRGILETYISTLPPNEQKKIDERVMEFIMNKGPKENKTKNSNNLTLESGLIEAFQRKSRKSDADETAENDEPMDV